MELTADNAAEYLRARGIESRRLVSLGGGVSNMVLLVESDGGPFVLKQSLAKLRVQDDWRADRGRILRERDALLDSAAFLPGGAVPRVLWSDPENYLFAMSAVPGRSWKEQMFDGILQKETARRVGTLLGLFIGATWRDASFEQAYGDQTVFDQLRIDPYYRSIAQRHPDVADAVRQLIHESAARRVALVHGDWSPKNILIEGDRLSLIDFEVVHFGDPSFDSAFCLNHLVLKWFRLPSYRGALEAMARAYWAGLLEALPPPAAAFIEAATLDHLGFLLLARVDGKSPAEYLKEEALREQVRRAAKSLICSRPESVEALLAHLNTM